MFRQPLTAPVRPPTICFWKIEKQIRAGIIDIDVNASTLAVSTAYWELNIWTPSGTVYFDSELIMYNGSM